MTSDFEPPPRARRPGQPRPPTLSSEPPTGAPQPPAFKPPSTDKGPGVVDQGRRGLASYWRWTTSGPKWKLAAGLSGPLLLLLIIISALSGGSDDKDTPKQASSNQPVATSIAKPAYQVVGSQGSYQFVVVSKGAPKEDLKSISSTLCKTAANACILLFWDDATLAAAKLPMTDEQVKAQVAQYNLNKTTGLDELVLMSNGSPVASSVSEPKATSTPIGSQAVYDRINSLTDCKALQAEFDQADENGKAARARGNSDAARNSTAYMEAADKRLKAVGCYR